MRTFPFIAAASLLMLGGTGLALAQHHAGPRIGFDMERADANGDGVLTLDEAKTHSAARFAKMDVNADGAISAADREARAQIRFNQTDANGDGEISPDEMTAARAKREAKRAKRRAQRQAQRQAARFEKLDKDGSGGLSQAELAAGKVSRAERRAERSAKQHAGRHGGRRGPHRGRGRGRNGAIRTLKRADTNNDQAVSREEFDTMIEARFARIDTDRSGTITQAEREAAKKNRRGPRERHRSRPHQSGETTQSEITQGEITQGAGS